MQHYEYPPFPAGSRPYCFASCHRDFLKRLGDARRDERLQMVLHSHSYQLSAIGEVADSVRREKIQVSERDAIVFRRKATVLRIVASATETDNRKKRQLIINHKLIPRLLKREYIRRTIGYVSRSQMIAFRQQRS